jgi:hypothetical protein
MTRRPVSRHQRFDRVGRGRDFHYWHKASVISGERHVRSRVHTGSDRQTAKVSLFDPHQTMRTRPPQLIPLKSHGAWIQAEI